MDAFYASVEQRDRPELRGRPVAVAWRGARSVVCAASYEARAFGVRSAMPALRAEKLCPDLVFVPPDFPRYKSVSRQVRAIMQRHTELIEPLSLDEAYLDVTHNKRGMSTASAVAQAIRADIADELALTASAGVAPNKFLAKIASDWRKPNGQFVVKPHQVEAFLTPLPVGKIPGVGKVTEQRMQSLNITTVGDLRAVPLASLLRTFGSHGQRLHELARGIDERPVTPHRQAKSVSTEDTFATDLPLNALDDKIRQLAEKTWAAAQKTSRTGRTVVLKLKTAEFRLLTRSLTPAKPPDSAETLAAIAFTLRDRVDLPPTTRYRLAGVGLHNFSSGDTQPRQADMF